MARNTLYVSEVNLESRSETMSRGRPWRRQISRAKILAKSSAFLPPGDSGMKCAILENRSTTTQSSVHIEDSGRSVIKSMAMDCHGAYGTSATYVRSVRNALTFLMALADLTKPRDI